MNCTNITSLFNPKMHRRIFLVFFLFNILCSVRHHFLCVNKSHRQNMLYQSKMFEKKTATKKANVIWYTKSSKLKHIRSQFAFISFFFLISFFFSFVLPIGQILHNETDAFHATNNSGWKKISKHSTFVLLKKFRYKYRIM